MKNNGIKNLKVLGASLCLGAVLLTGCGEDKLYVGNSKVILEEGKTTGFISYEDLSNYVKIVSFQQDNVRVTGLMIKEQKDITVMYGRSSKEVQYTDLETGATFIKYRDYVNDSIDTQWYVGEDIIIISEENITSYLLSANFVKKEYTIEELLTFLDEKILPTLEGTNKELVK